MTILIIELRKSVYEFGFVLLDGSFWVLNLTFLGHSNLDQVSLQELQP